MASLEFHEYLWDTPVREIEGKEIPGFLLAASGPVMAPTFFAHYVDGVIEAIDPAAGFPRPDPDPAVRTKRVAIPPSLRTRQPNVLQRQGGRYSGQMRRVVQCLHSRGLEAKFGYAWARTHGILEFPQPRQIGSTAGEESVAFAKRRFWVIEISASGVYAAPIRFGLQCMTCAVQLSEYMDAGAAGDLDLAWAYVNKNESGKVLRLLDASAIAPAYAAGSPWYTGMGWAFSWSGWAASNVVQRSRTLPDHYETRLIDLAFSAATLPTACSIELLPLDHSTARVTLAGHGVGNNQSFVVSGAEQAAYNGTHIAKNVTPDTFDFAVQGDPFTPATGNVKVTSASGPVEIGAALTIGSPGRVTFRPNDLGTLWVPGSEQPTRWVGIRPFSNILNASGPVHVFYDGEEKIATNWSSQSSTVPLDQLLSPHPPPEPIGPIPPGVDPNILWAGVTEGFHYWADAPSLIGPIAQLPVPGPDGPSVPPCMLQQQAAVLGSGHSYGAYTDLSWGFSGPFSLVAEAYARRRVDTETHFHGELFHDSGFDWANNGGYRPCGGNPEQLCAATFIWQTWSRDLVKTTADAEEAKTGSASLVLLPLDREAVAGVRRTSASIATSSTSHFGRCRGLQARQVGHSNTPGCPFTQFVWERAPIPFLGPATPAVVTNSQSSGMSFSLRASGGISVSGSLVDGASPDFDPFVVYQVGVKETADSSLFFMRGGLEYPDAGLAHGPANQIRNHIFQRDGATSFGGAFAALPAGRGPVAFIGQV